MIKAKFIRDIKGWKSNVKLYKLSELVVCDPYNGDDTTEYVVISALDYAFDTGRPETLIFPSDKDGEPFRMLEMNGSYRGGTSHEQAIEGAGWELDNA